MDANDLVDLIRRIARYDPRKWALRPFDYADRDELLGVIDRLQARGGAGWAIYLKRRRPMLAIINDRIHVDGMSVPINPDPWLAAAQVIAAIDAARHTVGDSRPTDRSS